jgi:hypothetical protein
VAYQTRLPPAAWVLSQLKSIHSHVEVLLTEIERIDRRAPYFTVKVIIENETLASGNLRATTEDFAAELSGWHKALAKAVHSVESESSGGSGPPKSRSVPLISELADLFFQQTGSRAGRGGSRAGAPRTGPFVRFVAAVNGLLPPEARIPPATVPTRIRQALEAGRM